MSSASASTSKQKQHSKAVTTDSTVSEKNFTKMSKTATRALRHTGIDWGLTFDENGYTSYKQLIDNLKANGFPWLEESHIDEMVATDPKNRYVMTIKGHQKHIKASQGHSMEFSHENEYHQITPEEASEMKRVFHGTNKEVVNLIKTEGLKRMERQYVHTALTIPPAKDNVPGIRSKRAYYFTINLEDYY